MTLTQTNKIHLNEHLLSQQIDLSNALKKPLYLLFIATKPCYIKLASVVHAFEKSEIPFLVVDVGQHYDPELISAQHELNYAASISIFLAAKGDLLERNERLHSILRDLHIQLKVDFGLKKQAIPLVSGDTSSAGIIPLIWYLATGIKSIHIEGGLRSFAPRFKWTDNPVEDLKNQFNCEWEVKPDQPFPEGMDTRLASLCSQLFFAPIPFNQQSLLREGYSQKAIVLSGSLSADAINLIQKRKLEVSIFETFPVLTTKKWIRVDIHRRENMTRNKLKTLFEGLKLFQKGGGNIVLVMTNALTAAIERFDLQLAIEELKNEHLLLTAHWDDYGQVIDFICSDYCLGIYTDSGGLQEESNVLGIKCATFRYSTDRPESIFEGRTNVLLPPINPSYIAEGLFAIFMNEKIEIGSGFGKSIYGKNVGDKIVETLIQYQPETPVIENIISY